MAGRFFSLLLLQMGSGILDEPGAGLKYGIPGLVGIWHHSQDFGLGNQTKWLYSAESYPHKDAANTYNAIARFIIASVSFNNANVKTNSSIVIANITSAHIDKGLRYLLFGFVLITKHLDYSDSVTFGHHTLWLLPKNASIYPVNRSLCSN